MGRLFNGTSDVITVNNASLFGIAAAFAVSAWVKGAAQNNKTIYGECRTAQNTGYFDMASGQTTTSKARIAITNTAGTLLLAVESTATAFDSTWHHLCYTQDASRNYVLYIDGVSDKSGTYTSGTVGTMGRAGIGAFIRATTGLLFAGTICHVATWSRQLGANEALGLANGTFPLAYGPDHYWPLFGADSPEPDLGIATHTTGVLTGTAFAAGHDPASLLDFAGATVGA